MRALIVGGGIGGLAAALACSRIGAQVELFERFAEFTEVGAGIQLGPNVVKVLYGWGLSDGISRVAAFPDQLQIRSALTGAELGVLRLGKTTLQRYGYPYAAIHRADLHALLLAAVTQRGDVQLRANSLVSGFLQHDDGVALHTADGRDARGDALVGADGLWSGIRQQLLNDGLPRATGHLAYRALVKQAELPEHLRSQQITAWLGPRLHMVQYPVRGGEWLNVVAIVQGRMYADPQYWDHTANAVELHQSMAATCRPVLDLIHAIENWRLWALSIRAPMRGASDHAKGRVALLGDAAHPMLPYLAQGAGMAIEDADELGRSLAVSDSDVPGALGHYAVRRWRRNARVQARAIRNGKVFHMSGPVRIARDLSMKLLGERLLDLPWLYRGPQ
jgi:salicylate hydroxylase